jgi:Zn-dependent protease
MILRYFSNQNDPNALSVLVISAIVMIMALILHNIVQAWVASRYGDNSARFSGFMRFDPQQHLEPFGALFLFLLGFGWPKTIPTNSRNYKGRGKQEAWVWYSGPLTYFAVAFICYLVAAIFGSLGQQQLLRGFLAAGDIAVIHAVINLFPVFPLDGAKAALAWGNPNVRRVIQQIASWGSIGFILIFFVLSASGITGAIASFFRTILFEIINLIPGL